MERVTILLSGGVDSAVLLWDVLRDGKAVDAVFVDYGQAPWLQEAEAVNLIWLHAREQFPQRARRLVSSRVELNVSTMNTGVGTPGPRVVPQRNMVLLALAANLTDNQVIMFGATAEDRLYPDCSEDFAIAAGFALNRSVLVPLARHERGDILRLAEAWDVPVHRCWSCYEPDTSRGLAYPAQPCGRCNSCLQS